MTRDFADKFFEENRILKASLTYAVRPDETKIEELKRMLMDSYHATDVVLEEKEDKELIGGYILRVGDNIYDNSFRSAFGRLEKNLKYEKGTDNIISILKSDIEGFEDEMSVEEGGVIINLHDGIVSVEGINNVMYGEIVLFENGVKGLVQNIDEHRVLCVVLGECDSLSVGDKAVRTGKRAGIGVSDFMQGRVTDALGAPIDGAGAIPVDSWYMIERKAAGVMEREPVNVPLETGIMSIDSMIPIGRGQRELIIGDRQTGKTSIAVDTIINQKGKNVICVYVAIGQKASTVAQIVDNFKKHGAMEYTVVVAATAGDGAAMQYLAPYSGTAIAEYFMDKGRDVLIVYDDLSKHAVAYRALSLLLERSPGREAYPGDVFYLHSRLLERSCHMDKEHGGGSITALPIIETQAGDVSAYIPTNVISITDGQIFLENDLFYEGFRPAVNVGLSVSRVGGEAQTKAVKKVSGTLRLELAQYKEIQSFSQFSSDLDEDTRKRIIYGEQLMELLKQPLYHPLSQVKQVVYLLAATSRKLLDVPKKEFKSFIEGFYNYIESTQGGVIREIAESGLLSDDNKNIILNALTEYKKVKGYVGDKRNT